ncbi:spermidine/putrescine ABC transporter ATP-binding protein [Corynebacterium frankenforstense DSM 45800]|uniref:Spermidine/putrescine ABC transporter ATP-binding protein n=1 Tax=Corynebacterium frankenforstense DSM 45800 TaxID=1437875 RepID=A0A1L7CSF4_9CORY|nr:ABC transporter ATP-binding protein [Corynebacterium frankenforstense]APT88795.1 spermidine/putrescine ABC transporter ATP-binding protein [Corynebacterium frankenforstense DSM 45800]
MSLNPSSDPGLVLDGVVKRYGANTAVDGFSMTAGRGEITALLGPNGAGKTTTIEICEGFHAPDAGSVRVLGLDPAREPERVRGRIGIMLQGGGAYSGIRVRELLRLTASYNRDPLDPDWLLGLLGLERVAKTTYRRLSGGQQQRLSLALAVIGRPELVFLDEPTAGLDAQSRLAVWDLVRALRRDGVTVLLTTHLMDEAESLADQVVVIDHGRRVAAGTPAELTAGQDGTRQDVALSVDGDLDAHLLAVAAGVPEAAVSRVRPRDWRVTLDPAGPTQVARLVTAVAEQGVLVRGLEVAHRSLEDVFLDLTGRSLRR